MIPVTLQPEPADFDIEVRQKGHKWLTDHGIALYTTPLKPADLPNYWTYSNKELWKVYGGVCAYLAIFFEWSTGASSTDHFIAKSRHAGMTYEWDNYRLSSLGPNRNKNKFDDVLDPIGLTRNTFVLNLASGEISPNKLLKGQQLQDAKETIERLKLDGADLNDMRSRHFLNYIMGDVSDKYLQKTSPFVWYEVQRQGLL